MKYEKLFEKDYVVVQVGDAKKMKKLIERLHKSGFRSLEPYCESDMYLCIDNEKEIFVTRTYFAILNSTMKEVLVINADHILTKPTKKEIINQLHSLKDNSESMIDEADADDIFKKDVEVLNIVIDFIEKNYE